MLATVLVLSLVVVAFWRSVLRLVVAAVLVLLVFGGIQAVQILGAIAPVAPTQCVQTDQNRC